MDIAVGSLEELHYQCILTRDLGYMNEPQLLEVDDQIQRVGFLISRLRNSFL